MSQNDVLREADDVAARVARRSLTRRGVAYAEEVRRLLDAGLAVMVRCGTSSSPKVADIVAAAGLSNEAFYRHFPSKGALVTALLEDGAERLRSYLAHQMAKESAPERQVARWAQGILSQAAPEIAATTLAVLWNGGNASTGLAAGRHFASGPISALLHEPFRSLGSRHPQLHATLAAHATLGVLSDHLWKGTQPAPAEVRRVTDFCLAALAARGRR